MTKSIAGKARSYAPKEVPLGDRRHYCWVTVITPQATRAPALPAGWLV